MTRDCAGVDNVFMDRRDRESPCRDVRAETPRGQAPDSSTMGRRRLGNCFIHCLPQGLWRSGPTSQRVGIGIKKSSWCNHEGRRL